MGKNETKKNIVEDALDEREIEKLKQELDRLIDENKSLSGAYTKIINEMEKRINTKMNINPKNE